MKQTRLDIKTVITEAFRVFKAQWKFFVVLGVVLLVGRFILDLISRELQNVALLGLVWALARWAVELYSGLVLILVALRAVDGEELSWKNISTLLPSDVELIKNYAITSIIYGLIVAGGVILLIVPGVIWAIMYSLATYLTAERGVSFREALATSKQLTSGNRIELLLIGIALLFLNILGALFFGLGIVITMPVSILAGAVIYRILSGERKDTPVTAPVTPVEMSQTTPVNTQNSPINEYQL